MIENTTSSMKKPERGAGPAIISCIQWVLILFMLAAIFLHSYESRALKADIEAFPEVITEEEADYINAELDNRNAGNCEVEPVWYGWRCVEINTGRVFHVYKW